MTNTKLIEALHYCLEDINCEGCPYQEYKADCAERLMKDVTNALEKAEKVEPIIHGRWIKVSDKAPKYCCTECNHLYNNKEYKRCPFCGAKMDGGKE